jgi:hypothetical protein
LPPFILLNKYAYKFYLSASDGNVRRFLWFFKFRCCLHFRFGSSRFRFRGGCFRFGGSHLWVRMHHCRLSVKIRAVSFKSKLVENWMLPEVEADFRYRRLDYGN